MSKRKLQDYNRLKKFQDLIILYKDIEDVIITKHLCSKGDCICSKEGGMFLVSTIFEEPSVKYCIPCKRKYYCCFLCDNVYTTKNVF